MYQLPEKIDKDFLLNRLTDLILDIQGNPELFVEQVQSLVASARHSLVFCNKDSEQNRQILSKLENCVVLVSFSVSLDPTNLVVQVSNPRLAMTRLITQNLIASIHPTAIIHPDCVLGKNSQIGPYAVIGACHIGDDVYIGPHVVIESGVRIGNRVRIKSGAVIGTSGFGYEKDLEGVYHEFVHLGSVVIEDDVHLGANSCVDRGALNDTIIRRGVKIDNFVHIAHNCEVGENSILTAMSEVSGSVKIGAGSWMAPGSLVINGVALGRQAFVGIGAIVTESIPDHHRVVPAFSRVKPPRSTGIDNR